MSVQQVKSPRWDHCQACLYPWPCREALIEQLAVAESARAALEAAFEMAMKAECLGCAEGSDGHWYVCSQARALLARPAGQA